MNTDLPIVVTAEIAPNRPDPSATAAFAHSNRALAYGQALIADGDFSEVSVTDLPRRTVCSAGRDGRWFSDGARAGVLGGGS